MSGKNAVSWIKVGIAAAAMTNPVAGFNYAFLDMTGGVESIADAISNLINNMNIE